MQINNNLSCIPFYDSLDKQDYRKWYAYGYNYLHKVPNDYLIPFYFVIPDGEWSIMSVLCYKCDNTLYGNITAQMLANGLTISSAELVYVAIGQSSLNLPKGDYYITITLTNNSESHTYYSDVFFVDTRQKLSVSSIKIEWKNVYSLEYDGGFIPYEHSVSNKHFSNILYIDAEIGKPTYNFVEEGEERNGTFLPTKQLSEKVYNFSFVAPEYLCDIMRLIRMADFVSIIDKFGRTYNAEQFELSVDWLDTGYLAEVKCSFQTNTVVKKTGLGYIGLQGDFNSDYNNDYSNQ